MKTDTQGNPVRVAASAATKWRSNARNILLGHGTTFDNGGLPAGVANCSILLVATDRII
jgi:hypothetical protein